MNTQFLLVLVCHKKAGSPVSLQLCALCGTERLHSDSRRCLVKPIVISCQKKSLKKKSRKKTKKKHIKKQTKKSQKTTKESTKNQTKTKNKIALMRGSHGLSA